MEPVFATHDTRMRIAKHLGGIDMLCLRAVCQEMRKFFSFDFLRQLRPVQLPDECSVEELFHEGWYLMFIDFWKVAELEEKNPYWRLANA